MMADGGILPEGMDLSSAEVASNAQLILLVVRQTTFPLPIEQTFITHLSCPQAATRTVLPTWERKGRCVCVCVCVWGGGGGGGFPDYTLKPMYSASQPTIGAPQAAMAPSKERSNA